MAGGRLARSFGDFSATLWYDYLSGSDDPADGDIKVFDIFEGTGPGPGKQLQGFTFASRPIQVD